MSNKPMPQQIYRHFKGSLYRIITLARHSETNEELVVYQALYGDYQVYARPIGSFLGKVDREKYPDASQEYRFELMQEVIQTPVSDSAYNKKEEHAAEEHTAEERVEEKHAKEEHVEKEDAKEDTDIGSVDSRHEQAFEQEEELNIDPLVLEFLDADSYEERLNILAALYHRITDEMINTMAVSVDLEIGEGDIQERYEELKNCLLTLERYECNRLR